MPRLVKQALMLSYHAAPRLLIASVVLSAIGALLGAAQVLLGKYALQDLLKVSNNQTSIVHAMLPFLLMAALASASGLMSVVAGQLERLLGERVQRAMSRQLIGVSVEVDLEAYEDPTFFDHQQRVLQNAAHRPIEVTQALIGLVRGIVGVVGLTAALLTVTPVLVPILLLVAVPLVVTNRRASRLEFSFVSAQTPVLRKRYYLQEVLTSRPGAKEVRAFGLAETVLSRWDALWRTYLAALRDQIKRRLVLAILGRLGATFLGLFALLLLLYLVAHHKVSLASAGAAALALLLLSARVEGMATGGGGLYESSLFLDDLDRFLSLGRAHHQARPALAAPRSFSELRAEGLGFTYPGSKTPALDDVSLTIQQGEVIALVGENGSGKTTLAKLLCDLYRPTSGRVLWDGQDIAQMDPVSVREAVAVIFQEWQMYALPASDNIGIGRPEAIEDYERVLQAARQSGADEFLRRLPDGYNSFLSKMFDGGVDLSVGQWQRIALARAFFRDAPFVVLDEPSSALDPRAEHELFSSIRTLLGGRTVLMISHRFSSVRSADRIYVMKHGRIIEHGSHDELMDNGGLYSELFTLQADAYLSPTHG